MNGGRAISMVRPTFLFFPFPAIQGRHNGASSPEQSCEIYVFREDIITFLLHLAAIFTVFGN